MKTLPDVSQLVGVCAPQVARFVVRHKRRRLGIEPVDIDPDAEARLDAVAGSGGFAAAMLCGGPPRADKPFDF
jgi:elongator complex protein 4